LLLAGLAELAWFPFFLSANEMLPPESNHKGTAQKSDFQFYKLSGLSTSTDKV